MNKEINYNFGNLKKKIIAKDNIFSLLKKKYNSIETKQVVSKFKDNSFLLKESFSNNYGNYLEGFSGIGCELTDIIGSCNLIVQNNEEVLKSLWKHFKQNVNQSNYKNTENTYSDNILPSQKKKS